MMNTKAIVGGAAALIATAAVASMATLAVTSSTTTNTDIVTLKGDTVTVAEYYDFVKDYTNTPYDTQAAKTALVDLVVQDVLEKAYGSKVSDKSVQEEYEKETASLGDDPASALANLGYTVDGYKKRIRNSLLQEYAVKQAAKKSLTDEEYQAAYDSYTPEVTAQIIKLDEKGKAEEVLQQAKEDGADFAQLAKDNSTDDKTKGNGGTVTFDSTSSDYPAKLKEAIFALEVNKVGDDVVEVVDSNNSTSYYVIKLNKKSEKSDNWKDYKSILETYLIDQKAANQDFENKVIGEELTKANVKVKDQAFQSVFSRYLTTSGSSSASDSSDASSSSAEASSSAE